jgi:MOSC domain-containing protein YiiM
MAREASRPPADRGVLPVRFGITPSAGKRRGAKRARRRAAPPCRPPNDHSAVRCGRRGPAAALALGATRALPYLLPDMSLVELRSQFPQAGRLVWVGLRPSQGAPMTIVSEARVLVGRGLEGDRTALRESSSRQVTLIQFEHLAVIASLLGKTAIPPELTRRNLAVSGINLLALRERRFSIGGVRFQGTGPCAPCRRLEETLGPGGFNASRGHGGITARALSSGAIRVGDAVEPLPEELEKLPLPG